MGKGKSHKTIQSAIHISYKDPLYVTIPLNDLLH